MKNRLIHTFVFDEKYRSSLIFSDATKIRLNSLNAIDSRLMLRADNLGKYSTATNLYIETGFSEINAAKKFLGMECIYRTASQTTLDLPAGTSIRFKVKTTGGNYFHNGAAWAIAGANDWNTETEINDNLITFPIATVGNKKIAFVINLVTTDENVTPEVYEIKLLAEVVIETYYDLVYDSVIRLLNTEFRATGRLVFQNEPASISAIDLASVLENKGYNIFEIESVYDLTADPQKLTDLFLSYTLGAAKKDGFTFEHGTITTNSIPADAIIEVTFKYVPEIGIRTNQDFFEEPSYPTLIITRVAETGRRAWVLPDANSQASDFIRNKTTMMAVQQYSPSQKSYHFDYIVYTGGQEDQMRIASALKNFFANKKKVFSWGLGIQYDLISVDEINTQGSEDSSDSTDTNLFTGSFDVLGVLSYDKESIDVPLVQNVTVTVQAN